MLSPKDPCRYPLALLQEFQSVDFIHHTANSNPFHQMSTINLFTPTRPLTYQVSLFSQLPFPQPLWVSVPYSTSRVESWPIVLLCPVDGFLCTIAEVSTWKKSKCCMSKEFGVQGLQYFWQSERISHTGEQFLVCFLGDLLLIIVQRFFDDESLEDF